MNTEQEYETKLANGMQACAAYMQDHKMLVRYRRGIWQRPGASDNRDFSANLDEPWFEDDVLAALHRRGVVEPCASALGRNGHRFIIGYRLREGARVI